MEVLWKWNLVSKRDRLDCAGFVVNEIVLKRYSCDLVYVLTLVCFLRFLKSKDCIASVFWKPLLFFEQEMIERIRHVRLQIKDDANVEIIARLYEFIPFDDIKHFIDEIRKTHRSLPQSLHTIRCDYFNVVDFSIADDDVLFCNLKFHPNVVNLYSVQQYVHAYAKHHFVVPLKTKTHWRDYFQYDIRFVPAVPNQLFLTQLFESMDDVCIEKKYVVVLLNHLQNVMEDGYIVPGIVAKMILYKLSPDPNSLAKMLHKNSDVFTNFLIDRALGNEIDWSEIKTHVALFTQSQLRSLLHFIS